MLRPRSLQSRLLLGIFAGVTAILIAGGVVVFHVVDARLRQEFDGSLLERSSFYATTLETHSGQPKWLMGTAEWKRVGGGENPDYVEYWFLPAGRSFYKTPRLRELGRDLPRAAIPDGTPVFQTLTLTGQLTIRLCSTVFHPEEREQLNGYPVQLAVGRDTRELESAIRQIRNSLIRTGLAAVGVILLATLWIVRRNVRPVASLSRQIESIPLTDAANQFALPGAPSELEPVVGRLNALMDRVSAAIEHERQFTSNAAHELRNPLAAIRSTVEVALSRSRSATEYEDTLESVLDSQIGLQRVVDNLLLLARLESGHASREFHREPAALPRLLRKAWRDAFETAERRQIKAAWQVEDPGYEVIMVVSMIEIVLRNLFENAVTYAPEGSTVRIQAGIHNGECEVSVANDNPGLTEQIIENTFAPFWRADPNASGHRGNAGIGLALSRRIMTTLGGSLEARLQENTVVYHLRIPVDTATPSPLAGTPAAGA